GAASADPAHQDFSLRVNQRFRSRLGGRGTLRTDDRRNYECLSSRGELRRFTKKIHSSDLLSNIILGRYKLIQRCWKMGQSLHSQTLCGYDIRDILTLVSVRS